MIGLVVVGYVYSALDLSSLPLSARVAINDTLDNTTTGMTLLAVAIIVGAEGEKLEKSSLPLPFRLYPRNYGRSLIGQ